MHESKLSTQYSPVVSPSTSTSTLTSRATPLDIAAPWLARISTHLRKYERRYKSPSPNAFNLQCIDNMTIYTLDISYNGRGDIHYGKQRNFRMSTPKNTSSRNPLGIEPVDHEDNEEMRVLTSRKGVKRRSRGAADLPPFRTTFSPHDSPNKTNDYFVKAMAPGLAAEKTYLLRASYPNLQRMGWLSAYPLSSPARQRKLDHYNLPPSRRFSTATSLAWSPATTQTTSTTTDNLFRVISGLRGKRG
ncbi:hypothetical protein D9619_007089 [Psilocybe cf. subviscida]|uniref:Uncharacterized protein n=1 Tax=Psilocybe cf. subviscida TaxID=2480587 RepID=A0A8H5EWH1_9AGAR|nr:hypothetical protein D9619_007089 [Psilocybe cf. subviscida]